MHQLFAQARHSPGQLRVERRELGVAMRHSQQVTTLRNNRSFERELTRLAQAAQVSTAERYIEVR
jgi:hypothetical protein